MIEKDLKEVLEGEYIRKEYINDNTLLVCKEENETLKIGVFYAETRPLTVIPYHPIISIPLKDSSAYELKVNENGVAIFWNQRLVRLYDANFNCDVENDFLNLRYKGMFENKENSIQKEKMTETPLKEILEGEYLRKEYINDNTLLLYKEEDEYIKVRTLYVEKGPLATIQEHCIEAIPLKDSPAYEIQANEKGVAIFWNQRLISLYDAVHNCDIEYDVLSSMYSNMFKTDNKLLKKKI